MELIKCNRCGGTVSMRNGTWTGSTIWCTCPSSVSTGIELPNDIGQENWGEVLKQFWDTHKKGLHISVELHEWLKENYNPPTKK